jgi:outer membrane protein OmpA-like peptidoglycan-associated protein
LVWDGRVVIEGHTDATASDAYNLDLSTRRARSVVAWLVKGGIPAARLEARGYGRSRPLADNATAQGRALNRRVEVSAVK